MRRISEVLAELASDDSDLPEDVRETLKTASELHETPESDEDEPGLPMGWEGVEVVE